MTQCRTGTLIFSVLILAWFTFVFQEMDVPSTSRARPTASHRRLRQRLVADDLSESPKEMDAHEVLEEPVQPQEQPEVHG